MPIAPDAMPNASAAMKRMCDWVSPRWVGKQLQWSQVIWRCQPPGQAGTIAPRDFDRARCLTASLPRVGGVDVPIEKAKKVELEIHSKTIPGVNKLGRYTLQLKFL